MEYAQLNNGVRMPMIGYGTYRTPQRNAERLVSDALQIGYRHIDTAQCYGNESGVGAALANSGITRDELFVTTKTWTSNYADTARSIEASLQALRCDYVDLLIIHEPSGDIPGIYRALEDAYTQGKARAIGVSNFVGRDFDELVRSASVTPAIDQVETHVLRQQTQLQARCRNAGVLLTSWSPLIAGRGTRASNELLESIAAAHGKTASQVALRWLVQRGIPVIPKSTNEQHMRENLDIFDFELDAREMSRIASLDTGKSQFNWW